MSLSRDRARPSLVPSYIQIGGELNHVAAGCFYRLYWFGLVGVHSGRSPEATICVDDTLKHIAATLGRERSHSTGRLYFVGAHLRSKAAILFELQIDEVHLLELFTFPIC